jgi:hypothetical protein
LSGRPGGGSQAGMGGAPSSGVLQGRVWPCVCRALASRNRRAHAAVVGQRCLSHPRRALLAAPCCVCCSALCLGGGGARGRRRRRRSARGRRRRRLWPVLQVLTAGPLGARLPQRRRRTSSGRRRHWWRRRRRVWRLLQVRGS